MFNEKVLITLLEKYKEQSEKRSMMLFELGYKGLSLQSRGEAEAYGCVIRLLERLGK